MRAGLGVIVDRKSGAQPDLLAAPLPRVALGSTLVALAPRQHASRTAVPGPYPTSMTRSADPMWASSAMTRAARARPTVIDSAVITSITVSDPWRATKAAARLATTRMGCVSGTGSPRSGA